MTWYWDGKTLSTLAWNIKNRGAGWSVPARSGENIRVPGKNGTFWVPNKSYDEGHLNLQMWVNGSNADGTLPTDEDGRKKVRDNIDTLTALFSSNNHLHTLRQVTGSDMAIVNELTNPSMLSKRSTGIALAYNGLKDADRSGTSSNTFSHNIALNPFALGNKGVEEVVMEDLYPDPALRQHQKDRGIPMMYGYYYPIKQDKYTYDQFWTRFNAFGLTTGVNGHGVIDHAYGAEWGADAWVGSFERDVSASRADKTLFMMNFRLAPGASPTTLTMRVTPLVSEDGDNWSTGTAVSFTATKSYQWVIVPSSNLPSMSAGNGYYVQYRLEIVGASSIVQGANFELTKVVIQDAPKAGNPWIGYETSDLAIIGGTTSYIWNTGNEGYSWSTFTRPAAPEWEVVNTGSRATTSPYAFAWSGYDDSGLDDGWLCFTVVGGTQSTFRRVLPVPTRTFTDSRIWGRCWNMVPGGTLTGRITERTGTAGSYTYTPVGSFTFNTPSFSSGAMTLTAGHTYCLEFDVPHADAGFEPTVFMRELHVSNAKVDDYYDTGTTSKTPSPGSRSYYAGAVYSSTLLGSSYGVYGYSSGMAVGTSKAYTTPGVSWYSQGGGVYAIGTPATTEKVDFSSEYTVKTLIARPTVSLTTLPHLAEVASLPTSASATLDIILYNGSGSVTRTVSYTMTGVTNQPQLYTNQITINAGEVAASASVYITGQPAFVGALVHSCDLIVNKPADVEYYNGNEIETASTWVKTFGWVGTPYFSQSYLKSAMSSEWAFDGFTGFDADNHSVRFTGGKVTVQAVLPAGQSYIGYRRGEFTGNLTVTAKPSGAGSATSLGTITSSTDFVQALVTVPAGGSTSVEFAVTGGSPYATLSDAFAVHGWSNFYPVPSSSWAGFSAARVASLSLMTHPSSQAPTLAATEASDYTTVLSTGTVLGWSTPIIGGGYLVVPTSGTSYSAVSEPHEVVGSYVSVAARIQPASDAPVGSITMSVQGATASGVATNTWTTLNSVSNPSTAYWLPKVTDISVGTNTYLRLVFTVTNNTLTRSGAIGVVDGTTLSPSIIPLGSNFPGYFNGVVGSDGVSTYRGNIRQCHVEVVDAIDMIATGLGTIAEFDVSLTVPGAFWEDVYDTIETVAEAGGNKFGTFFLSDFGGGTAPTEDALIEITPVSGTITSLIISDKSSGNTLAYASETGTSKIIINSEEFTVRGADGQSIIKDIDQSGTPVLFPITPYWKAEAENISGHVDGVPIITWLANVPIQIVVTGRRKYLVS